MTQARFRSREWSSAFASRVAMLIVTVVALGCARKAPGPKECRAFALAAAGLASDEQIPSPGLRAKIDALTHECLVTPYDRELLRCFGETGRFIACHLAFEQRLARRR